MQSQPDDAQAIAQLVQDIEASLAHLRRAQGFGRITVEMTVANGVITRWEIAPHVSRKVGPDYARNQK